MKLIEGRKQEYYTLSSNRVKTEKIFILNLGETHSIIQNHSLHPSRKILNEEIFETPEEARQLLEKALKTSEFKVGDTVKCSRYNIYENELYVLMEIKKTTATLKCCKTGEIRKARIDEVVKAPNKSIKQKLAKLKFEKDEWYRIEGKNYQFVEKLEGEESYWEAHWLFFNKGDGGVNLIAELKGNYYDLSHKEIKVEKIKIMENK